MLEIYHSDLEPLIWNSNICNIWYNDNDDDCIDRCYSRFLQCPHYVANCLQHVRWSCQGLVVCKSCAAHQTLIMCSMLCACCSKVQLSCYVWQGLNRIYFSFMLLAEIINQSRREENQSTRRKPLMTSFREKFPFHYFLLFFLHLSYQFWNLARIMLM